MKYTATINNYDGTAMEEIELASRNLDDAICEAHEALAERIPGECGSIYVYGQQGNQIAEQSLEATDTDSLWQNAN